MARKLPAAPNRVKPLAVLAKAIARGWMPNSPSFETLAAFTLRSPFASPFETGLTALLRVRRKGVSKGALRMRLRVEPSCPIREIGGTTQVGPQNLFYFGWLTPRHRRDLPSPKRSRFGFAQAGGPASVLTLRRPPQP
jgi:hypothetical protein